MSCSSFPVGRSGPTRVAPPERQLEIRAGNRMRECRETLGFLTMDGSIVATIAMR